MSQLTQDQINAISTNAGGVVNFILAQIPGEQKTEVVDAIVLALQQVDPAQPSTFAEFLTSVAGLLTDVAGASGNAVLVDLAAIVTNIAKAWNGEEGVFVAGVDIWEEIKNLKKAPAPATAAPAQAAAPAAAESTAAETPAQKAAANLTKVNAAPAHAYNQPPAQPGAKSTVPDAVQAAMAPKG